jgi:hypothetical protein
VLAKLVAADTIWRKLRDLVKLLAGEPEAAEQLDLHATGPSELTIGLEALGEPSRRAHRAHRVRARRADADLENVEHRDMHGLSVPSSRRCARFHRRARAAMRPRDGSQRQNRIRVLMLVGSAAIARLTSCCCRPR